MNKLLSTNAFRGVPTPIGHALRYVIAVLVAAFITGSLIPAMTTAQADAPVVQETILDVTLEHELLPDEWGFVFLGRVTAEPGSRQELLERGEQGTIVIVVEEGTLTYEIKGEGSIIRGANSEHPQQEEAPAGAPFALEAGDALVYPAQGRIEANEHDVPVVFLFAVILEPIFPPEPNPSDVGETSDVELGYAEGKWSDLVSGPVTITLQRTLLAPGAHLPRPAGGTWVVSQETGTPGSLVSGPAEGRSNVGDAPIEVLVLMILPATSVATPAA